MDLGAMSDRDRAELERALGHVFEDREILETALVHRSKSAGSGTDNERLEFLGDAVVGLVIADLLQRTWPLADEGVLSRRRAALVNAVSLAAQARQMELGSFLVLGRGEEKTGGREKDSILAGAYEAVIGAVYLDGGFATAFRSITNAFDELIMAPQGDGSGEPKTHLQELTQRVFQETPQYDLVCEQGPDHAKEYEVSVSVQRRFYGKGRGRSKKLAEQAAAAVAIERLAAEDREESQ
ncbi:MAG: ribonuclease III [bacterium]